MAKISKVLFMGSKELGLRCLTAIHLLDPTSLIGAITLDDRNDPRSVYDKFQAYTSKMNIKLFVVQNRKEFEELIQKLKSESCIVATLGHMLCMPNRFL